ncbi:hypothetical protein ACFE04_015094 [Oxalis oulophora]
MDYSQAALKVLCSELKSARQTPSQNSFTLGGILFQRAWLQGVLVHDDTLDCQFLDDGSDLIQLSLSPDLLNNNSNWFPGMYVMVVGCYFLRPANLPIIKVHKIVDLSASPDREAMWFLEVMEAYKLFYQPLIEEME